MKNQIRENLWQDCETKLDLQRACLKLSFIVVVHMPVLSTEWEKCYFSCSGFWYFKKAISITFSRFFFFFQSGRKFIPTWSGLQKTTYDQIKG